MLRGTLAPSLIPPMKTEIRFCLEDKVIWIVSWGCTKTNTRDEKNQLIQVPKLQTRVQNQNGESSDARRRNLHLERINGSDFDMQARTKNPHYPSLNEWVFFRSLDCGGRLLIDGT